MLKVAVVGLGKIGQRHMNKWTSLDNCKVVGIVGRNEEKLSELGTLFDASTSTSLDEVLNNVDVDVVDICLPTFLHLPYVKQAAMAKKHVICEKPLGLNQDEAKEMIKICNEQGVKLFVAHTLRFAAEYVNARKQVKNGAIGKPGVIRLSRGTPLPGGKGSWYTNPTKSGGMILDLGIHDIDWLIWTFGDVKRAMAKHIKSYPNDSQGLEYALITLRMVDGTIAHLELSWAKEALETKMELAGDKGMIVSNNQDSVPIKVTVPEATNRLSYLSNNPLEDPFLDKLAHFRDCIVDGKEPIVTALDALKAITVADAIAESASVGQPVDLTHKEALR